MLCTNEVHVWWTSLTQEAGAVEAFSRLLSADELERAQRFHFQKDREHYIVARGTLRIILGSYLQQSPNRLRFRYSSYGKPMLETNETADLRFNLSHSHELALYAITNGREVGIDVEWIRPSFATEQIAEHFFSAREVAMLRALPAIQQPEAFFNCWTRKEAYIKARGEGLSLPLNQFDVSLAPGEPASLLDNRTAPAEISRWTIHTLDPGPGYVGAIVAEGQGWNLKYRPWPTKSISAS